MRKSASAKADEASVSVRSADWIFLALLVAGVFLLSLLTYSHLGEDAFISFRYSRNFAHGWGLVYNPGERVEGYSNLLWVLLMAPAEWVGMRLHLFARIVSSASLAALAVGGWFMTAKLFGRRWPWWMRWWPAVALAVEPLMHFHADRGLETVFYAALLGGAGMVLAGGGAGWAAGLLAGLAAITRPEGIGFSVCLLPALLARRPLGERRRPRDILLFLAAAFGPFLMQLAFRRMYYGAWIPNTMVAKKPTALGWFPVVSFACSHAFLPVIAVAGCVAALSSNRLRPAALAVLGLGAGAIVFQLRAGNLLNESFRYLMPLVVPMVLGVWLLVARIAEGMHLDRARGPDGRLFCGLVAAVLLALVPVMPFRAGSSLFRGNGDAPRSRLLKRLGESETWHLGERLRWFFHDPVFINTAAGEWVAANLPADAVVGGDQLGQFGFYAGPRQRIVDLLGLMDKRIAREGLTVAYLADNHPDYLVIECRKDSTFWPRDWRGEPSVASVRQVVDDPAFGLLYRPRWILESRVSYIQICFTVYVRRDIDDGKPIETVPIGIDEAAFNKWWRVL